MHKPIRMFSQEGFIKDDKDFPRLREEFERLIIEQMREVGCLPVYELGSHWATKWLEEMYFFKITIYGCYAGRKKAREYDFWCEGRLVKSG